MNELIEIKPENALCVFSESGKLDPLLEAIAKQVREFVGDISTDKGRKEIASMAYKVAQSKTYLDGIGKNLVDQYKELPKKIDANRKTVRDFLDNLRDEVRKPLDDYETEQLAIQEQQRAEAEKAVALAEMERDHEFALLLNVQFDRDQADKAKAEQEAKAEHERQLAEQARKQADIDAQAKIEAAERANREALEKAEREKNEAIAKAEREVAEANQRAERARIEEAQRQSDATAKQHAETIKRMADTAHKATINRAILAKLIEFKFTEEQGKELITLIATNKIPHTKIEY